MILEYQNNKIAKMIQISQNEKYMKKNNTHQEDEKFLTEYFFKLLSMVFSPNLVF